MTNETLSDWNEAAANYAAQSGAKAARFDLDRSQAGEHRNASNSPAYRDAYDAAIKADNVEARNMTTTTNITTDKQIEQLRSEAAAAGDDKQVALCDQALRGNVAARVECERVIADAAAQS